ncbi:hypothetical protein SAMN05421664_3094 [Chryseobacterium soldanellicola]|uniref:Uncharacterized protein n=1 Tax=Chryseobacterium soldanellicola TaxID=311333 RepID=A0A1H1FJ14_9FLAO|nr:hypothetical protein [Chryseobacterium soldanellicola]SDR00921.1 hypothetical protein SAMN05421664_3094 [Chryseobacterium soldanellicola]
MSEHKKNKLNNTLSSNTFDLEPIMKFKEMSLDQAMKILNDSKITISEQEASEILVFLHTIVKITLKEFLSPKD